MKQNLPKYPKYKPSGVAWFSVIPAHWGLYFLGNTTNIIQTGPFGSQLHASDYVEDEVSIINPSNISNCTLFRDVKNTIPEKKANQLSRHRVKSGDIIFGRRGEMGRCGLVTENEVGWICGTGSLLVRLKSKFLSPQYAIHLLSQVGVKEYLILESVGATMDNLNTRIISKLKIPLPSVEEQTAIVTFLDRETAKIDRLMSVRRQQIEVLQEQRAAVIHHAVTKGLDPDVEMKPSGVEWLGEIPEHWKVMPLWAVAKICFSNVDKKSHINEIEISLCNYIDVYKNEYITDKIQLMRATATIDEIKKFSIINGDVFITKDSEKANDIAVPSIIKQQIPNLLCGYHLAIIRVKEKMVSEYIFRAFQTKFANTYFTKKALGVTRFGISQNTVTRYTVPVPVPSLVEQAAIVTHIEAETAKIDALTKKYQRELDLLEEYRASLISHAVTGKIDVRGLAETTQEAAP